MRPIKELPELHIELCNPVYGTVIGENEVIAPINRDPGSEETKEAVK